MMHHSQRDVMRRLNLAIMDFELLRVLGEGSLSTVFLARRKATGTQYALKVIDKFYVKRHNMTDAVIRERHVMDQIDSDWVVRLQFTFQVCHAHSHSHAARQSVRCLPSTLPFVHARRRFYTPDCFGCLTGTHERMRSMCMARVSAVCPAR